MDIEFHYYITYIIAARAGFNSKEAYLLAYSSQYVDDNDTILEINKNLPGNYSNYISQTMNILKPKLKLFRIYPLFHFIPGDPIKNSTRRKDGKLHYLNTTPNSLNARKILAKALESKNIYRIGIACHAYADTWAHQNFVGYYDEFNAIKGLLQKAAPRIGHVGAGFKPDRPSLTWEDCRLIDSIKKRDNKSIFLAATEHLFLELRKFISPDCALGIIEKNKESLINDISEAIGEEDESNEYRNLRIERYKKLAQRKEYGGNELIDYKLDSWIDEAISEKIRGFRVRNKNTIIRSIINFISKYFTAIKDIYYWKDVVKYKNTNWFKFQEAVKAYQEEATNILREATFDKMELENW